MLKDPVCNRHLVLFLCCDMHTPAPTHRQQNVRYWTLVAIVAGENCRQFIDLSIYFLLACICFCCFYTITCWARTNPENSNIFVFLAFIKSSGVCEVITYSTIIRNLNASPCCSNAFTFTQNRWFQEGQWARKFISTSASVYLTEKMAAENYHLKWDSHLSYLNSSVATLYK